MKHRPIIRERLDTPPDGWKTPLEEGPLGSEHGYRQQPHVYNGWPSREDVRHCACELPDGRWCRAIATSSGLSVIFDVWPDRDTADAWFTLRRALERDPENRGGRLYPRATAILKLKQTDVRSTETATGWRFKPEVECSATGQRVPLRDAQWAFTNERGIELFPYSCEAFEKLS